MSTATARSYRFGDSSTPGVLLGLSVRQAVPVVVGVLWLVASFQTPLGPMSGIAGLAACGYVAFGRWRGAPVTEIAVPALRVWSNQRLGRRQWTPPALLGTSADGHDPGPLPAVLAGLELLEMPVTVSSDGEAGSAVVVRDRRAGALTTVLRVSGNGFPLATPTEQDTMLTRWGGAFSPFAHDQSPVSRVVWQESTCATNGGPHHRYLTSIGTTRRGDEDVVADYLALVDQQEPPTREVLVTLTVDQRRVRAHRGRTARARLEAGLDVVADETRLLATRLNGAGLTVDAVLDAPALATTIRQRSDPACTAQIATLAAAAGRAIPEWGPMAVEPCWSNVRVDGAWHRSYRVASWPALQVPADWLAPLLAGTDTIRTITVVMEPVPLSQSARAADREATAREADADSRARRGFRVGARERKRLSEVEAREQELAQGHAEFRFAALLDVCAPEERQLADAATAIEQAAAQTLLDLRPLDARHELGWVAALPLGRNLRHGRGLGL